MTPFPHAPPPAVPPGGPPAGPARRERALRALSGGGVFLELVKTVGLSILVFLLLQAFVGRTYAVEQTSMEMTLLPGQHVIVDRLTPHFDPYKRGDIIVFAPPAGSGVSDPLIKRVIGVAGDTIDIRDGAVYVNGQRLVEPYTYGGQPTLPIGDVSHWVVGPGQLFVLGDHRAVSIDSRVFGPIEVSSVVGRAWLRILPLDRFGFLAGAP